MNRRSFFKWLGIGAAAAVVAPSVLTLTEPVCVEAPKAYSTYVMGRDAYVTSYFDYANFSDFAATCAIDKDVQDSAAELGYRQVLLMNELMKSVPNA